MIISENELTVLMLFAFTLGIVFAVAFRLAFRR